jgi:hypothetical protein
MIEFKMFNILLKLLTTKPNLLIFLLINSFTKKLLLINQTILNLFKRRRGPHTLTEELCDGLAHFINVLVQNKYFNFLKCLYSFIMNVAPHNGLQWDPLQ